MSYTPNSWTENVTVIHKTALDNIENGIAAADANATSAQTAAASAQTTADNAQTAASTAQTTANSAQSAASSAQTAASTALDAAVPPYQFKPEDHGAVGDGKIVGDVVTTNGSATITSATAVWTSTDVGKHIMVGGALDAAGGPLISTISTFNSATSVTLADPATRSASGLPAAWGTDDTAAVNSAVADAKAYALAHNYYGEVIFGAKVYVLAAAPTQQAAPVVINSQVPIPYVDTANSGRKLEIGFKGAAPADHLYFWESTTPNLAGTTLLSMATGPSPVDGTYGVQSVIGGPVGGAFTGGMVNTKVHIANIQIVCGAYTNLTAFDFTWIGGVAWSRCGAHILASAIQGTEPVMNSMVGQAFFQGRAGVGVRCPANGDNADSYFDSVAVEGYSVGIKFGDHTTIARLATIYSDLAGYIDSTVGLSGISHNVFIGNWTAEVYNGGLLINGGYVNLDVTMSSEVVAPAYDLKDVANAGHGEFRWTDPANSRSMVVNGAVNVAIRDCKANTFKHAGAVYRKVASLTDAASIATDASLANIFEVTITANRAMAAPSNPVDGQEIVYAIVQGVGGSHTITWDAAFAFSGAAPTLQTTVGAVDAVRFVYVASASKWVHVG